MSEKVFLPHHSVVAHWKEGKVIKWLKKMKLEDCIPAFETRHIDGIKLLDLNEQKLFTYQDLKIKHRKQIAKCVQECKSQASNAKRIAKTLKQKNGSKSCVSDSNGAYDSDEDSDVWGSDFDSDDEMKDDYSTSSEVNNNSIIHPLPGLNEKISASCPVLPSLPFEEKSIPKPPDVPVISKSVNDTSSYKRSFLTGSIPRTPLKRPPSQPPPPPVQSQVPSQEEPQEDYEIPIVSDKILSKENLSFMNPPFRNHLISNGNEVGETYEIIEPPEENYEVVDAPHHLTMTEKPILPPRQRSQNGGPSPPPPLPQKPQKLKDTVSPSSEYRADGIRTFSRPKLPNEGSDVPHMGFISSLIGRSRANSLTQTSPKVQPKNKSGDDLSNTKSLNDGFGSPSSDTNGNSVTKAIPIPTVLPKGTPVSSPDDTVSNMASRPLPPVPGTKEESDPKKSKDILQYPWFHEMEREAAEAAVRKLNEAGAFVVRPSKRAGKENPYSLTVLHENKLFHLNIRQRPDKTFALGKEKEKEKTFPSVGELIIFHLSEPILLKNRGEPAGKTILGKYPEKTS